MTRHHFAVSFFTIGHMLGNVVSSLGNDIGTYTVTSEQHPRRQEIEVPIHWRKGRELKQMYVKLYVVAVKT